MMPGKVPTPPPSAAYLLLADVLQLVVAAGALSYFLFAGTLVSWWIQFLVTLLLMWVIVRGGPVILLAVLLGSLVVREPRSAIVQVNSDAVWATALCVGLIAYTAGFRALRQEIRSWLALACEALFEGTAGRLENESPSDLTRRSLRLALRCLRLLAIVLVSLLAFANLPVTPTGWQQWWQRSQSTQWTLWPGPTILMLGVAAMVGLSLAPWYAMGRTQARLYIRSTFVRMHYRELRSIVWRSMRHRAASRQAAGNGSKL